MTYELSQMIADAGMTGMQACARVGVTHRTLMNYASGEVEASIWFVMRLAPAIGRTPSEIFLSIARTRQAAGHSACHLFALADSLSGKVENFDTDEIPGAEDGI